MEKLTWRRHLTVAGFVLAGGAALAGCAPVTGDYDGIGNEFVVRGPLDEVTVDLVEISNDQMEILFASERAREWFAKGFGQEPFTGDFRFHDHYYDPTAVNYWACGGEIVVGQVVDNNGNELPLEAIDRDDYVEISGRIQDSYEPAGKAGCQPQGRAVFDTVVVLEDR